MSELHSETNDKSLGLTVRIKMVDLDHTSNSSSIPSKRTTAGHIAEERLSAFVGRTGDRAGRLYSSNTKPSEHAEFPNVEICMLTGDRILASDFETHIESCSICANRVALQLDFMEVLEVATYQRMAEPESQKVRGAMLISTPELNFAVCGELEV